ncbi:MAG: hypothetical protein AAFY71_17760 [Bacteroidota bacterium]
MKNLLIPLLAVCIFSCNQGDSSQSVQQSEVKQAQTTDSTQPKVDSNKTVREEKLENYTASEVDPKDYITVDDFSVTDEMLRGENDLYAMGIPFEGIFFQDSAGEQLLFMDLHTDKFHFKTLLVKRSVLSADLLKEYLRFNPEYMDETAIDSTFDAKGRFIPQGKTIEDAYFTSNKGIFLGMPEKVAIPLYSGGPVVSTAHRNKWTWNYFGEFGIGLIPNPDSLLVAKNSFGHEASMYTDHGELIALILRNDIP